MVEDLTTEDAEQAALRVDYWAAYLRIGFAVVVVASLGVLVYLRVTPHGPHRTALVTIALVTAAAALGIFGVAPRAAARAWRAEFSLFAALVSGAVLTLFCALDGGVDSPMAFLMVLPVLNAAVALPRWAVMGCGSATFAEIVVLAATDTDITSESGHLVALMTAVLGAVGLAVSIAVVRTRLETAERAHRSALRRAAETDMLTGCLNQRAFDRLLSAELDRFDRYGVPFSLALADVDLLKAYNDTYGHQAGDEALAELGRRLRTHCRPSDTVARIGGDEFAVILCGARLAEAVEVAKRLGAQVNGDGRGPTMSIGVAEVPATDRSAKRLFREADAMLYEAKARGRATVAARDTDSPVPPPDKAAAARRAADRKLLEQRIDQSEREKVEVLSQLEALLSAAPVEVGFVDRDLRFQMVNEAVARRLGVPKERLVGRNVDEASPAIGSRVRRRYEEVMRPGMVHTFEAPTEPDPPPGHPSHLLITLFPVFAHGAIAGVGRVAVDITDRKRLEQAAEHLVTTVAAAMATTIEAHDPYTAGHEARVAEISRAIAEELGLDESERRDIALAATVHDVGKIRVPAEVLARPGRLTDGELALVREHARVGYEMLMSVEFPEPLCQMVLQHHERLDGSGYPDGLRGDRICRGAKIMAVADVVDAMSSRRPYRGALGIERALREVEAGAGARYDAAAVEACARLFRQGRLSLPDRPDEVALAEVPGL